MSQNFLKKSIFENYANFNGRACPQEARILFALNMIINFVDNSLAKIDNETVILPLFLLLILSVLLLIPSISVNVRRLHDINKSGWWLLISLTIIGIFPLFYWLYLKAGDPHENDYGAPPST